MLRVLVDLASMPMVLKAVVTSCFVYAIVASPTFLVVVLLKERNTHDSFENYDVEKIIVNYPTARRDVDAIAVAVNALLPLMAVHVLM